MPTLTEIPDHLLAEIFLRLPTAEDLARTSAACVSFRRLVTDRSFLRRFRRLHAPPLLGFLDRDGFHPALPPHPSAAAARALALAADFSFSFLPSHCRWTVQDIRDGRVLLAGDPGPEEDEWPPVFREIAVCDPLHRRYILLPQVPDDLAASLEHPVSMGRWPRCDTALVPVGQIGENKGAVAEEAPFEVILLVHCDTRLAAFVFSSSTTQWQATGSKGWNDVLLGKGVSTMLSHVNILRHHYANGCSYWELWNLTNGVNELLLLELDTRRMEFSIAGFPGGWNMRETAIVEAGEYRLGMFGVNVEGEDDLSYTVRHNKGESSNHWQMEKTFSLGSGYQHFIGAAMERHLLLVRLEYRPNASPSPEMPVWEYFSMDVRTLQLEKLCAKQHADLPDAHIYTNFPPSLLSLRTI